MGAFFSGENHDGLVSVIVPVYKERRALVRALKSIFAQIHDPIEVILVDDGGGTDLHWALQAAKPSHRRVDVHIETHEKNKGAGAARNTGARFAKGEYLLFWDADIIAKPDMVARMVKALAQHPEAAYAYSGFYWGWKKMPGRPFDAAALRKQNYITTTSLLRKSGFPGFDESLRRFIDWDLWLTLLERNKTGVFIDDLLFCIKPGGTMSTWLPKAFYKKPWRFLPWVREKVARYEAARERVLEKHGLH